MLSQIPNLSKYLTIRPVLIVKHIAQSYMCTKKKNKKKKILFCQLSVTDSCQLLILFFDLLSK